MTKDRHGRGFEAGFLENRPSLQFRSSFHKVENDWGNEIELEDPAYPEFEWMHFFDYHFGVLIIHEDILDLLIERAETRSLTYD